MGIGARGPSSADPHTLSASNFDLCELPHTHLSFTVKKQGVGLVDGSQYDAGYVDVWRPGNSP